MFFVFLFKLYLHHHMNLKLSLSLCEFDEFVCSEILLRTIIQPVPAGGTSKKYILTSLLEYVAC